MHWFWRGVIAVVIGTTAGNLLIGGSNLLAPDSGLMALVRGLDNFIYDHAGLRGVLGSISRGTAVLVGLLVYAALSAWFPSRRKLHPETLCRKCGYILRGISEPRCPECGVRR